MALWNALPGLVDALLAAFPGESQLGQLVEFAVAKRFVQITTAGLPLADRVRELLRWAVRGGVLAELLARALELRPGNRELSAAIGPVLGQLAGEPGANERAEIAGASDADAGGRGLLLVAGREHAAYLGELEDALAAVRGRASRLVGRRYVNPDRLPAELHGRLDDAQDVVVLVGADLAVQYPYSREGLELLQRHYDRRLRLIPVALGGIIDERLEGIERVDGLAGDRPLAPAELAARIAVVLARDPSTGAGESSLRAYASAAHARLARLDAELGGFVEPTKVVLQPGDERRQGRRARGALTHAPLSTILAEHRVQRAVALLGEPGAGKSVLLRRLALQHLAALAGGDERGPVPIYVRLAAYTERAGDEPVDVVDFLRAVLAAAPPAERHVARELGPLLARGKLLVLLDGMDEMPRADFGRRTAKLREFVQRYECPVVIACRERDFDSAQLDLMQVRVRPFSDREIAEHLVAVAHRTPAQAQADARTLTRADHPLAMVARNPLSLGLIARHRAAHDDYPRAAGELFERHVDGALDPAVTGLDAGRLRDDLAGIAFAMAELDSPGTAVPLADVLAAVAGSTHVAADRVVQGGVQAGLLRRDASTGALLFAHARVQELFIARHLLSMDAAVQRQWLVDHAAEQWFDEVYVLAALRGLPCGELIAWVVGGVEAHLDRPPASDDGKELEADEARLVLVGRLAESAGLPADVVLPAARALARLWSEAARRGAPGRTRLAVLEASRGAMLAHEPLAAIATQAARSRHAAWRREAWRALASAGRKRDVRRAVLRQAVSTNYVRHAAGDQRLAGVEPRLAELRRWSSITFGLHLGLLIVTATWYAAFVAFIAGPASWLFSVIAVALFHLQGLTRAQDGEPSTVRHVALSAFAGLTAAIGTALPEVAVRALELLGGADAAPLAPVTRAPALLPGIAIAITGAGILAGFTRVGRRFLDDGGRAFLAGAALGTGSCAFLQVELAGAAWSQAVAGLSLVAVVLVFGLGWLRPRLGHGRAAWRTVGGWTAGLALAVIAWFLISTALEWIGEQLPRATQVVKSGVSGLLGVFGIGGMLIAAIVAVVRWIRNNARAARTFVVRDPCTIGEAARHLQSLESGDLVALARGQVFQRLQGMTPLSRVVQLVLTAAADDPRWSADSELATALRELGRRRARAAPSERATFEDELVVLAAGWSLQRERVTRQWLGELSPEERAEVEARTPAVPARTPAASASPPPEVSA